MKFKKSKLLISLLSIGGVTAILIPTIALTSCSSTLNPYLSTFTSRDSGLSYTLSNAQDTANLEKINFTVDVKTSASSIIIGDSTPATEFKSDSFTSQWASLKQNNPSLNLPESIASLKTKIDNSDVLNLIKNQNYLNIFIDSINNLKNIYDNFFSALVTNNWLITELIKKDNTDFFYYLYSGVNSDKFYAKLRFSDIKMNISIKDMPISIGQEGVEKPKQFNASISNIQLKFEWFQDNLDKNEVTKITSLEYLKSKGYKGDKLSFELNPESSIQLIFNMLQNKIDNKYYETGLIRSDSSKPLIFPFETNEDEQNNNKTDWLNKEILNLDKEKVVTPTQLNNLFAKIGYLTKNNLQENNFFPSDIYNEENINLGKVWINSFIGYNNLF